MGEPSEDPDVARVSKAVEALSEHFDTVQVFVTRHINNEDGTAAINLGAGNWYARYGQVQDFIVRCDEDTRIQRRSRDL
jgi:hypothetical protein